MSQNRFLAFVLVFFSLVWWSSQARAQTDFGQRIWWKSDHNSMSAEVNRVLGVPSATYPAAGTPNVNGAHFTNAAGQWPVANQKTNLPFPGKSAPIDVVARVKPASVGAALGRFAAKVSPIGTAVALVTLASELGFTLDNSVSPPVVTKSNADTLTCTVAPCTGFYISTYSTLPTSYTRAQACERVYTHMKATTIGYTYDTGSGGSLGVSWGVTANQGSCYIHRKQGGANADALYPFVTRAIDPQVASQVPSTTGQLADKIASQSGWPSNSHIRDAIAEAIKNGETIEYDPAQVSGPASVPAGSSSSIAPDGTVTNVTVNHNYTYNGPKVTVTTTTTTTTTAPGGSPVTSTRTDTNPAPEATPDEDTGTPTDTALPGQPELYTPEYPEGLKGVWNAKKGQLEGLPILDLLDDMMPNVAGSGTCPSWTIDMDMYIVDYGSHVIAIPCWVWDFGKVVIICSALLLSRRLIFGG